MGFGDKNAAPTTGIGVKKPNLIEKCSKEEWEARIKAIAKSKRDIAWWAENFFNIITMDEGMKVIQLYPKQREFLQHLVKHNKTICLSSRQTGKCEFKDTIVTIRNKKTNEIIELTVEQLFEMLNNK